MAITRSAYALRLFWPGTIMVWWRHGACWTALSATATLAVGLPSRADRRATADLRSHARQCSPRCAGHGQLRARRRSLVGRLPRLRLWPASAGAGRELGRLSLA